MKTAIIIILAIIVLGLIIYITFIKAILEIAIGAVLLVVAAGVLWWIWSKIKDKVD